MLRLAYLTETVLSNEIAKNRIALSFKDSPGKPLRRRPIVVMQNCEAVAIGLSIKHSARAFQVTKSDMICNTPPSPNSLSNPLSEGVNVYTHASKFEASEIKQNNKDWKN